MQEQHIDDSRSMLHKRRWRELLGGNQIAKRVILALSFLVILTCFLHFREVRMEVLEIGTQAPRYVISQTDFFFLDDEEDLSICVPDACHILCFYGDRDRAEDQSKDDGFHGISFFGFIFLFFSFLPGEGGGCYGW